MVRRYSLRKDTKVITNNFTKYEYKAILLPSYKENPTDTARLKELTDELNKAALQYWEPTDLSKHLPGGYVLLRRSIDAAASTVKKSPFAMPKLTMPVAPAKAAPKVVPPVVAPVAK